MSEARIALVLGGARSGKSRYAETFARGLKGERFFYVATGEARDEEMRERIAAHRAERWSGWQTVEEPLAPSSFIAQAKGGDVILVDCLTLWLSNLLLADRPVEKETAFLCETLNATSAFVVLVTNEVGLGIVPDNALARRFRDAAGRLNQEVATIAGRVVFLAAGLPLVLKG
jgi:adenosylcobinamide kinase/adenosylcobinamide-phosphate guanylyltransferase